MSQQQQIDENVTKSLSHAGIRPRYHRQQLANHPSPNASMLLEWVTQISNTEPHCGWTLIGGNSTEDLAILVARGLHVTSRTVRIMSVMRFQAMLRDGSLDEWTAPAQSLLVTHMGPQDAREKDTFTSREIRSMADWLNDWLADGRRLLVHATSPLENGWFSASLVQRIGAVNETLREDV